MKIRSGFTLIEVIASMTIMSAIGLILITFVSNGYNAYLRGQALIAVNDESTALTSRIANGLRGTFLVINATGSEFKAQSYFAPADATPTQITITKSGSTITLNSIQGVIQPDGTYIYDPNTASSRIISNHFVSAPDLPLFQYYDETQTLQNDPVPTTSVHLVGINSTIFSVIDPTQIGVSSTKIELRNLKTNL